MTPCKDCQRRCRAPHPLIVSCTFATYLKPFIEAGNVKTRDDFVVYPVILGNARGYHRVTDTTSVLPVTFVAHKRPRARWEAAQSQRWCLSTSILLLSSWEPSHKITAFFLVGIKSGVCRAAESQSSYSIVSPPLHVCDRVTILRVRA